MRLTRKSQIRKNVLNIWILISVFVILFTSLVGLNITGYMAIANNRHKQYTVRHFQSTGNSCIEQHNAIFLKTHKTGSSTIANIMQRFGHSRDLNFALPRKKPGQVRYNYFGDIGDTLSQRNMMPSKPRQTSFDILYNHVIFNSSSFEKVFLQSPTYFTILRHPLAQFESAVLYFIHQQDIYRAVTTNVTAYLESPAPFEPENRYLSFTDNRQALDLGVPPTQLRNKQYIKNYIEDIDNTFGLVMITEYFDESLIMLKRRLCWKTKDILYIRKNTGYRNFSLAFSDEDKRLHRKWAMADCMLYEYFHEKFVFALKQDPTITQEAFHFKQILKTTHNFCRMSNESRIEIAASKWNERLNVTSLDCAYLRLGELEFLNKLLFLV